MAAVDMLALLCAGSTRYHAVNIRSSGGDSLSKAEIAGLLSGLDALHVNFVYAKYCNDVQAEQRLINHVTFVAELKAQTHHWKIIEGKPSIANMASLAVFDAVRPNRCGKCNGTKIVGIKVCACCNGSGVKALSGRIIASAIGVDQSNYVRVWKVRYQVMYEFMQDIDFNIKRQISMNSYGDLLEAS